MDVTLGSGSVTPAHVGDYHYTISNAVVTGLTLTSQLITVAVSATCGDGFLNDPSEVCDDGNLNTGDGCDAACLLEVGEPCTGDTDCASNRCNMAAIPAVCAPPVGCGNGALESGEGCDDGNTSAGDSCDPQCLLELGAGPCTDGTQCGSGICNTMAAAPVCAVPIGCGNGVLNDDEVCDDGNLNRGDGCSQSCTLENNWRGGGGCAVSRDSESGGPGLLLNLLLLPLIRRRNQRNAASCKV